MTKRKQNERGKKVAVDLAQASIFDWTDKALLAAEQLRIKTKAVEHYRLPPAIREVLVLLPTLPAKLKSKVQKEIADFTVAEIVGMVTAISEALSEATAQQQRVLLLVAMNLTKSLHDEIVGLAELKLGKATTRSKTRKATKKTQTNDLLYQFKVTLLDTKPPIWRRIQVKDCTLDKLHEFVQTAMGWTNSHLHQFTIDDFRYADPELMEEDFERQGYEDSTETTLSDLIPKGCKPFSFEYEYDFGDSWNHKIAFEGFPNPEKGAKYPLCLEGERACPPEDVGGVWGYYDFLEAIANPKHEEHENLLQWAGGSFDAVKFSSAAATKKMRQGLPNWREMA